MADAGGIEPLIEAYLKALTDGNAAVFAGAGLSIPAGMVDWRGLLRSVARQVGLDVDKEQDLVSLAQFHVNEHRGRHAINQAIVDGLSAKAKITENHKILAALPIRTYWTTNYDPLIEDALKDASRTADVKVTVQNLAITKPGRDATVFKMHGDAAHPDKAVVTKDDYEDYNTHRQLFSMALQGDLVSKTFLFIGFSFNDPNLGYILARIRSLLGENRRQHYALLRRVQRGDFKKTGAKKNTAKKAKADYQYALARQELQVRDLDRYGIKGVLVDDYAQITEVLRRIAKKFRMSRVFISGSADSYDPWSTADGQALIQDIAGKLIAEKFGIVSGSGVGVGGYVVNGVVHQLEREATRIVDNRLVLRPFPLGIADPAERQRVWANYRKTILEEAGIAIFLFGNKKDAAGKIIPADGVEKEFDLAVAKDLAVIPVGCTGSMAETLHGKVLADIAAYFPARGYKKLLAALGRAGRKNQLAPRIVALCKKLRDEA